MWGPPGRGGPFPSSGVPQALYDGQPLYGHPPGTWPSAQHQMQGQLFTGGVDFYKGEVYCERLTIGSWKNSRLPSAVEIVDNYLLLKLQSNPKCTLQISRENLESFAFHPIEERKFELCLVASPPFDLQTEGDCPTGFVDLQDLLKGRKTKICISASFASEYSMKIYALFRKFQGKQKEMAVTDTDVAMLTGKHPDIDHKPGFTDAGAVTPIRGNMMPMYPGTYGHSAFPVVVPQMMYNPLPVGNTTKSMVPGCSRPMVYPGQCAMPSGEPFFGLVPAMPGVPNKSPTEENTATESESGMKRKRQRLTSEQSKKLEDSFKDNPMPGNELKVQLASSTSLSYDQVRIWFQNRRAKHRRSASKGNTSINEKATESNPNEASESGQGVSEN